MHRKYSDRGLVAISLNLEPLRDDSGKDVTETVKKRALGFLQKNRATFTNLMLNEPKVNVGKEDEKEFWQAKFDVIGLPAMFVFDRQGKWHSFKADDKEIDHAEVEKLVKRLLAEK